MLFVVTPVDTRDPLESCKQQGLVLLLGWGNWTGVGGGCGVGGRRVGGGGGGGGLKDAVGNVAEARAPRTECASLDLQKWLPD